MLIQFYAVGGAAEMTKGDLYHSEKKGRVNSDAREEGHPGYNAI